MSTVQAFNSVNWVQQAINQVDQLIVLIELNGANPIQSQTEDQILAAAQASTLIPKPNTSLDGEGWDWPGYLAALMERRDKLKTRLIQEQGFFIQRTQGVV